MIGARAKTWNLWWGGGEVLAIREHEGNFQHKQKVLHGAISSVLQAMARAKAKDPRTESLLFHVGENAIPMKHAGVQVQGSASVVHAGEESSDLHLDSLDTLRRVAQAQCMCAARGTPTGVLYRSESFVLLLSRTECTM